MEKKTVQYSENWLKPAEKCQNPQNSPEYRGHGFQNSFIALPVPKNPMLEKTIFNLFSIRKKVRITISGTWWPSWIFGPTPKVPISEIELKVRKSAVFGTFWAPQKL